MHCFWNVERDAVPCFGLLFPIFQRHPIVRPAKLLPTALLWLIGKFMVQNGCNEKKPNSNDLPLVVAKGLNLLFSWWDSNVQPKDFKVERSATRWRVLPILPLWTLSRYPSQKPQIFNDALVKQNMDKPTCKKKLMGGLKPLNIFIYKNHKRVWKIARCLNHQPVMAKKPTTFTTCNPLHARRDTVANSHPIWADK